MNVYFKGLPTAVDVRKLVETFHTLKPGDEITHEDVERVLSLQREQSRYKTVTNAWRSHLLRHSNVRIGPVRAVGFRVLNSEERVNEGLTGVQRGVRKTVRSIKLADRVTTDDPILQKKQDAMRRLGAAITMEATLMVRQIEMPKPQEQMPRVRRS